MTQLRPAGTGSARLRAGGAARPGIALRQPDRAATRPAPGRRRTEILGTLALILSIIAAISLTTAILISNLADAMMSVGPPDPTGLDRSSLAQPSIVGSGTGSGGRLA